MQHLISTVEAPFQRDCIIGVCMRAVHSLLQDRVTREFYAAPQDWMVWELYTASLQIGLYRSCIQLPLTAGLYRVCLQANVRWGSWELHADSSEMGVKAV